MCLPFLERLCFFFSPESQQGLFLTQKENLVQFAIKGNFLLITEQLQKNDHLQTGSLQISPELYLPSCQLH